MLYLLCEKLHLSLKGDVQQTVVRTSIILYFKNRILLTGILVILDVRLFKTKLLNNVYRKKSREPINHVVNILLISGLRC